MSPWDAGVLGLLVGGVACLAVAVYFSRRLAAPSPSRASSGIFVFLAAIIVNGSIAIGGCVEGENLLWQHAQYYEKTTIKWEEPFDLEGATFSIDGTRVGKGLPAFAKVMRRLSSLHEGGGLTIQFPKKWNVMQFDGDSRTGDMWEFPFEGHLDKEKEFTKLCGEKNLLISFEVIE